MEVVTDRRVAERRQRTQPHEPDRRRSDRRGQPEIQRDLRALGFVIVKRGGA